MEADVSQDLQDYWTEYRIIQETKLLDEFLDEECGGREDGDGQAEAEWLIAAGYSELAEPFLAGCEVHEGMLDSALTVMSMQQAEAIRRRVDTLNHTVRQRGRQNRARHRKPDIRDVFRDVENSSTGSRSRSATPDSLDSPPPSPPTLWTPRDYLEVPDNVRYNIQITPPPSFVQIYDEPTEVQVRRNESRRDLRRLPSAPSPAANTNLFRSASRVGADVATETADGIKMLGYHRIGSVRYTFRNGRDRRSGSDPLSICSDQEDLITDSTNNNSENDGQNMTRRHSDSSTHNSSTEESLGFEEMWKEDSRAHHNIKDQNWDEESIGKTWVEWLGEDDLVKLRNLVFIELTVMMDSGGLRFNKRKPHKRKRKEDTCIFGTSLTSLVEKDQQLSSEPQSVPLVFQKVLSELERRGLQEEGILRVAGHKQKVEMLCDQLEKEFYTRPERIDAVLQKATVHDLATLLKRLIRDLPESILTNELVEYFYQANGLPDCVRALNLLALYLPTVNRATLHALITFLTHVIANQTYNKMSLHNVAMIIAPSLFPPRCIMIGDKGPSNLKAQISFAAVCCRLTETLLQCGDNLFLVPPPLLSQLRNLNEQQRYKQQENKPKKFLGRRGHGANYQIMRKIDNEIDFQKGIIRVTAEMFCLTDVPVTLTKTTTAGDVLLMLIEQASQEPLQIVPNFKPGRKNPKSRALSELAPNGVDLSCLLATADPEMALQTHFLHEVGGNIGRRRIEPTALLMSVYKANPNAQWKVYCDHRNGSKKTFLKM